MSMAVAGVAFAVLLVPLVVALYRGWSGIGGLFGGYPGEERSAQKGTSDPLHSASSRPGDRSGEPSRIPGVRAAMPVYVRQMAVRGGGREAVRPFFMAIDAPAVLAHGGGEADAHGLLSQAGRVCAQAPGALERDGAPVERPREDHGAIKGQERRGIPCEVGEFAHEAPVGPM